MFHTKHEVKCLYVSAVYLTRQRKIVNSLLMKLQSEWMASLRLTTCQCTHMTLEGAIVCIHVCERETGPGACGTLSWRMGRYPLVIAASSGMWVLDGPGSVGRWFVVVAYPLLCVIPGRSWAFGGLGSCPQLVLGWLASGQVSSLLHLVLWVSSLWRWGINLWPQSSFYGVEHTVFPGSCGLGSSILVCSWLTGDVAANCCPHYQERFALC